INHFTSDTETEISLLQRKVGELGSRAVVSRHWAEGGRGAEDLAREVLATLEHETSEFRFLYEDHAPLWDKIRAVATKIYGAADITADSRAREQLATLSEEYSHFPVCIAKTQYSFSGDPSLMGAPTGHVLSVREVRPSHGAEFVVAICGNMMTMPGLPRVPAAEHIDLDEKGRISGLF
ncbi:MAG: formate--tetrahydrofolate ligase, partial [Gammaproteobacteria bacterium]|nr:formate--tetrahydrofolate ligase [Gammaproteobacteria bacterium]